MAAPLMAHRSGHRDLGCKMSPPGLPDDAAFYKALRGPRSAGWGGNSPYPEGHEGGALPPYKRPLSPKWGLGFDLL